MQGPRSYVQYPTGQDFLAIQDEPDPTLKNMFIRVTSENKDPDLMYQIVFQLRKSKNFDFFLLYRGIRNKIWDFFGMGCLKIL